MSRGKISEEMLDLLLLGIEEVSDSEMPKAFTEFAEVRIKDMLEQQAAKERSLKVSEPSDKPWTCLQTQIRPLCLPASDKLSGKLLRYVWPDVM